MAKAIGEQPWKVGPLEGLWTADDPGTFVRREKGRPPTAIASGF